MTPAEIYGTELSWLYLTVNNSKKSDSVKTTHQKDIIVYFSKYAFAGTEFYVRRAWENTGCLKWHRMPGN
jgi:hypothetical protein